MPSNEYANICQAHRAIILKYTCQKPVPLGALANDLGITVKVAALDRGRSGLIERGDDSYRIKVNRYETRERQRYTLAHEIAHFLLHQDRINESGAIVDNVLYRSGQPEQIEYEANRVAADLILPDDLVHADLATLGLPISDGVIERLAREWQVSKAAMEIRLSSIQGQ